MKLTIKLTDGTDTGRTLAEHLTQSPVSLNFADLSQLDLTGVDFGQGSLRFCDFTGSRLSHATFDLADCTGALFRGAHCKDATFLGTKLEGVSFDQLTVWPKDFDHAAPMVKLETTRDSHKTQKLSVDAESPWLGAKIDGCVLKEKLGTTSNMVYRAHCEKSAKDYVIKVLNPALVANEHAVQRFYQEANLTMSLADERIVKMYKFGVDNGRAFLRMDYVPGQTLDSMIAQNGKQPWRKSVEIMKEVALALSHMHERGFVHRDVSPKNILFDEEDHKVTLIDLGLGKRLNPSRSISVTGQIVGTPYYMSPEQAGGKSCDTRADLYSLGVVLYYMVTGLKPFNGKNLQEIFLKHFFYTPESLKIHTPDVPQKLCDIVSRCLEKKKAARYQSAQALAEALDALLRSKKEPLKNSEPFPRQALTDDVMDWLSGEDEAAVIDETIIRSLDHDVFSFLTDNKSDSIDNGPDSYDDGLGWLRDDSDDFYENKVTKDRAPTAKKADESMFSTALEDFFGDIDEQIPSEESSHDSLASSVSCRYLRRKRIDRIVNTMLRYLTQKSPISEQGLDPIVRITMARVVEIVDAELLIIQVPDPKHLELRPHHFFHSKELFRRSPLKLQRFLESQIALEQRSIPMNRSIAGACFESGLPKVSHHLDNEQMDIFRGRSNFQAKTMLTVPIRCQHGTFGVVQVLNKTERSGQNFFSMHDQEQLKEIAGYLAQIMARAKDSSLKPTDELLAEYYAKISKSERIDLFDEQRTWNFELWQKVGYTAIKQYSIIPIRKLSNKRLAVAMVNPLDFTNRAKFEVKTGYVIEQTFVAPADKFNQFQSQHIDLALIVQKSRSLGRPLEHDLPASSLNNYPLALRLLGRIFNELLNRGCDGMYFNFVGDCIDLLSGLDVDSTYSLTLASKNLIRGLLEYMVRAGALAPDLTQQEATSLLKSSIVAEKDRYHLRERALIPQNCTLAFKDWLADGPDLQFQLTRENATRNVTLKILKPQPILTVSLDIKKQLINLFVRSESTGVTRIHLNSFNDKLHVRMFQNDCRFTEEIMAVTPDLVFNLVQEMSEPSSAHTPDAGRLLDMARFSSKSSAYFEVASTTSKDGSRSLKLQLLAALSEFSDQGHGKINRSPHHSQAQGKVSQTKTTLADAMGLSMSRAIPMETMNQYLDLGQDDPNDLDVIRAVLLQAEHVPAAAVSRIAKMTSQQVSKFYPSPSNRPLTIALYSRVLLSYQELQPRHIVSVEEALLAYKLHFELCRDRLSKDHNAADQRQLFFDRVQDSLNQSLGQKFGSRIQSDDEQIFLMKLFQSLSKRSVPDARITIDSFTHTLLQQHPLPPHLKTLGAMASTLQSVGDRGADSFELTPRDNEISNLLLDQLLSWFLQTDSTFRVLKNCAATVLRDTTE